MFLELYVVATVLTACGIETEGLWPTYYFCIMLQQCLPLAVLKLRNFLPLSFLSTWLQQCLPLAVLKRRVKRNTMVSGWALQQCLPLAVLKREEYAAKGITIVLVATVLTACGIETIIYWFFDYLHQMKLQQCLPLAVLKLAVCQSCPSRRCYRVATVLTACGIETSLKRSLQFERLIRLQQCLPLAVLKLVDPIDPPKEYYYWLQQCLPLAVLKPYLSSIFVSRYSTVATVLTACGIETLIA